MKHISILIPKGQFSIVNIAGTFQILNWANDMFFQQARKRLFEIEFVGHHKPSNDSNGFFSVMPSKTLDQVEKTDLIVVPAVHEDHAKAIEMNEKVISWIRQQYTNGAEIAAYCIGVFLLAETGLLNGKTCSTHWGEAVHLQEMFPEIKVQSEKIITECEGLYTSGGAYAFTNLAIYLIEKYGGRELAILTAKAFMIDVDKNDQSLFAMFIGQKQHQDEMVLEVQEMIEKDFKEQLNVEQIARTKATNRRTLERRFRAATGNSVIQYLQRVRIESAKKLLERENSNIMDTMFLVGYSDSKAFREVFRKHVGISPSEYRKKFAAAVSLG
ncbi:GlxA family transcriptional regulator [Flexithrix dorotheae]|uniref:GlxA family transcriptional regulator n=1 Tax=Flexithrix dorotheae TaxID=70993 RepID=UPI00035F55CF|nr:helix-turn-helix domain-containing protein [Flexithrix dorotheae]